MISSFKFLWCLETWKIQPQRLDLNRYMAGHGNMLVQQRKPVARQAWQSGQVRRLIGHQVRIRLHESEAPRLDQVLGQPVGIVCFEQIVDGLEATSESGRHA